MKKCKHAKKVQLTEYGHASASTFFTNGEIDRLPNGGLVGNMDGHFSICCLECGFQRNYNYFGKQPLPKWVLGYYKKNAEDANG